MGRVAWAGDSVPQRSDGASARSSSGSAKPDEGFYARWPMRLRSVPRQCHLMISTDREANLYVNGARLLRAWKGTRTLDVSATLSPGLNVLAVEWLPPSPPASAPAKAPAAPSAPQMSFEWLASS